MPHNKTLSRSRTCSGGVGVGVTTPVNNGPAHAVIITICFGPELKFREVLLLTSYHFSTLSFLQLTTFFGSNTSYIGYLFILHVFKVYFLVFFLFNIKTYIILAHVGYVWYKY